MVLERDLVTELRYEPLLFPLKWNFQVQNYAASLNVFDAPELCGELSSCMSLSKPHKLVISLLCTTCNFQRSARQEVPQKVAKRRSFPVSIILADRKFLFSI